ncbi:hypothetical protein EG328_002254 [Venturia inaequalis]|uniref:Uncharacterized protein n=1 Tax=Venturia inaequalis TaxID=5025 RepID=A0A8H3VH68_VENIN|nr:hypothetical protein EG328_002254 [Venturia inaequalis]
MDTNKAPPAKTPKTTFLTLPREIRQSILLQSLDTAAPGDQNVEMRRWRATLENIDVRLAEDMEYVVRIWNKSFGEEFYKDLAMWKRSCSEVTHANPRTTFSNLPAELQQAIIIQSLDPGQWLMELSTNGPYRLFEMEKEINEQVARLFAAEAFLV